MNKYYYIWIGMVTFTILIMTYGYYSGSCQINKEYECDNDFCLYKQFSVNLGYPIKNDINKMINNSEITKRVEIKMYPETILNCALPNKSGITISTENIMNNSNNLINFYQNELCDIVSNEINLKLYPTDLEYPTSCAILIYENENDWINWHYDYNYYNGRFFTVLIPITNSITCTKFQFKDKDDNVISLDLTNNALCFEGNYLYHRASKLCKGQKRIMLSCQYVTDNTMSELNKLRIKIKDYAYIGKLF